MEESWGQLMRFPVRTCRHALYCRNSRNLKCGITHIQSTSTWFAVKSAPTNFWTESCVRLRTAKLATLENCVGLSCDHVSSGAVCNCGVSAQDVVKTNRGKGMTYASSCVASPPNPRSKFCTHLVVSASCGFTSTQLPCLMAQEAPPSSPHACRFKTCRGWLCQLLLKSTTSEHWVKVCGLN
jgi:hypothetical protein